MLFQTNSNNPTSCNSCERREFQVSLSADTLKQMNANQVFNLFSSAKGLVHVAKGYFSRSAYLHFASHSEAQAFALANFLSPGIVVEGERCKIGGPHLSRFAVYGGTDSPSASSSSAAVPLRPQPPKRRHSEEEIEILAEIKAKIYRLNEKIIEGVDGREALKENIRKFEERIRLVKEALR